MSDHHQRGDLMPRNTRGREPRRWRPFAALRRQGGRLDPAAAWREYDRRRRARARRKR